MFINIYASVFNSILNKKRKYCFCVNSKYVCFEIKSYNTHTSIKILCNVLLHFSTLLLHKNCFILKDAHSITVKT